MSTCTALPRTGALIPRAPVLVRPFPKIYVPARSSFMAGQLIPRTIMPPRPFQHCQVPAPSGVVATFDSFHGQLCSRAHFSASICPLPAARAHATSSKGQSCSRAHRNTSRCPPPAAWAQVRTIPRAVVLPQPHQHFQLSACSGTYTRRAATRAPTLPSAHQHLQVSAPSGASTYESLIPRAPVRPFPPQHLQMPP